VARTLRFPTVLFDLDGTLTDPRVGITRGVQHALATVGIVVEDPDTLVGYIGPPIHDGLVEQHGVAAADVGPAVAEYRRYYREQGMYENVLYDGVPELLAELAGAGAVLAVATSKPQEVAGPILEHFGIASWFAFVGGASLQGRCHRAHARVARRGGGGAFGDGPRRRPRARHRRRAGHGGRVDRRRLGLRVAGRARGGGSRRDRRVGGRAARRAARPGLNDQPAWSAWTTGSQVSGADLYGA
jgi:hypothetical protein